MSPVNAFLGHVQQQAAALESDTVNNQLAVTLSARRVGRGFSPAQCEVIADIIAGMEAELRGQQQALAAYPEMAPNGHGRLTGPQQVLQ